MAALGSLRYEQGRKGEAEQWWQTAATAGHPGAAIALAAPTRSSFPHSAAAT